MLEHGGSFLFTETSKGQLIPGAQPSQSFFMLQFEKTTASMGIVLDVDASIDYYGQKADISEILNGKVTNPGADGLKAALFSGP